MTFRIVAAVLVGTAIISCTANQERKPVGDLATAPFLASFADAKVEAAKNNLPIYLDFYTDW